MHNSKFNHIDNLNCILLIYMVFALDKKINYKGNLDFEFMSNTITNYIFSPKSFNDISDKLDFDYCFEFFTNDDNNECIVASNNHSIYVTFCFLQINNITEFTSDFITVFNKKSLNIPNTDYIINEHIFQTFYKNNFLQNIINSIQHFNPSLDKKIYINGYSLGATLAFTFSYLYNNLYPSHDIFLHTYASPKFSNSSFLAFFYNSKNIFITNIFNESDIAPIFPICNYDTHTDFIYLLQDNYHISTISNYKFSIFNNYSIYKHLIFNFFDNITYNYLNNININ